MSLGSPNRKRFTGQRLKSESYFRTDHFLTTLAGQRRVAPVIPPLKTASHLMIHSLAFSMHSTKNSFASQGLVTKISETLGVRRPEFLGVPPDAALCVRRGLL